MSLLIGLREPLVGYVGINLGCSQRGMSQELLDAAQIRPAIKKVGCRGVTQSVGPQGSHTGNLSNQRGDNLVHTAGPHRRAASGEKHRA